MSRYQILHRINTKLDLHDPFEIDGINFSSWDYQPGTGRSNGWLAKTNIEAPNVDDAYRGFVELFFPLVDRISFVGQYHTEACYEPFAIFKERDQRFFWRHTRARTAVPLNFGPDQIMSLQALIDYPLKGDVFKYLHEATNANSFYSTLVMQVSAMEAIAKTGRKYPADVDKKLIGQVILEDEELRERLYGHGTGIRNQILHGGFVDDDLHASTPYTEIIHEKITAYFNNHHGTAINTRIVNRPRKLHGNYEVLNQWCELKAKDKAVSLKELADEHELDGPNDLFERIDPPEGF